MKKLTLVLSGALMLVMASCGGVSSVVEKMDEHKQLTQGDYKTVIKYVGEYDLKVAELRVEKKEKPLTDDEYAEKLIDIKEEYPYAQFLSMPSDNELKKENKDLKKEYMDKVKALNEKAAK